MARYGLLLTNIGTPKSFSKEDVGRYLEEFLTDPMVIRAPKLVRNLLVKGLIVPFRAEKSAKLYRKIWTNEGSPLLVQSKKFAEKLQQSLGTDWRVRIGMRYGEPSFNQALASMSVEQLDKIILFPMFPQYALSSSQSSIDQFHAEIQNYEKKKGLSLSGKTHVIEPYFSTPRFIESWVTLFLESAPTEFDHVVMSFHGLPLSHLAVLSEKCKACPKMEPCKAECDKEASQANCYRRQSFRTAELIAQSLKLKPDQYSVGFQSRLGPLEWIRPNTVDVVKNLAAQGKKKIVVLCPSFVADCLETLEEVHMGLKEIFIEAGGESLIPVPCLNAHDHWIESAKELVCKNLN